MRIQIVTDAWPPVVSGVVRTLQSTIAVLERMGHEVDVIEPSLFWSFPCPKDPRLRLAVAPPAKISKLVRGFQPDAVHIATEGTLGLCVRLWCQLHRVPFTTCYTTKLPEHIEVRLGIPSWVMWPVFRWFHKPSAGIMVSTESMKQDLEARGFRRLKRWSRGVDCQAFRPGPLEFLDAPRPILMYVGRVDPEKNIEAFLKLDCPGTKYVVGDGSARERLEQAYPDVRFVGYHHGDELSHYYSAADAVVFPSLTDTFGLVMLEAMACGLPVAAFPVAGPKDVVREGEVGALDWDLAKAIERALEIPRAACRAYAGQFSWEAATRQFLANLAPIT